jgi:hypothetical protein
MDMHCNVAMLAANAIVSRTGMASVRARSIQSSNVVQANGLSASKKGGRAMGMATPALARASTEAHKAWMMTAATSSRPNPRPLPRTISSTPSAVHANAAAP